MARIETDPNYTTPTFSRATAGTDIFKKEDVQLLASAMSTHDHTSGKGLAVSGSGIADGSITSAKILDGTITSVDMALEAASSLTWSSLGVDFSTTSTTYVDVTNATASLTTLGSTWVVVMFSGPAHATGNTGNLAFSQDGVDGPLQGSLVNGGPQNLPVSLCRVFTPAAGAHTWKLRARALAGGTVTMNLASAAVGTFIVFELRR